MCAPTSGHRRLFSPERGSACRGWEGVLGGSLTSAPSLSVLWRAEWKKVHWSSVTTQVTMATQHDLGWKGRFWKDLPSALGL